MLYGSEIVVPVYRSKSSTKGARGLYKRWQTSVCRANPQIWRLPCHAASLDCLSCRETLYSNIGCCNRLLWSVQFAWHGQRCGLRPPSQGARLLTNFTSLVWAAWREKASDCSEAVDDFVIYAFFYHEQVSLQRELAGTCARCRSLEKRLERLLQRYWTHQGHRVA